ncbi:MAG: ribosome silencing factor [Cyclobacteriaceae bacterium]|tara:strand:+ start:173 stop:547 length:375 start_codon:yes stop_codon:yes gene_type:complete
MRKNKVGETDSETLSEFVVQGMLEKKASDVVVLDLRDIKHAVADYFIICSGSSDTQIDAISDSIEEQVFKLSKEWPWKVEGKQNKEWVLIDYVNVVAHVFNKDKRSFYGLEELWGDAKVSTISV